MLGKLFYIVISALAVFSVSAAEHDSKPNVVYLLADDLGWIDVSTHPGGNIPTRGIDRLFKEGVQVNNFVGWCVCSPTIGSYDDKTRRDRLPVPPEMAFAAGRKSQHEIIGGRLPAFGDARQTGYALFF
jgi:hypothetical protein